jgi:subtilisin family serine protease
MKNANTQSVVWQRGIIVGLLLLVSTVAAPTAHAQSRLVVRDSLGLPGINLTCALLGCNVIQNLGDPQGQLFVVVFPKILDPVTALLRLNLQLGIVSVEIDQTVNTQQASAGPAPSYLTDETPVPYYGATVWRGYVTQPGNRLVQSDATHATFGATGSGVIVAVIDTGVDPDNAVLNPVLVGGYDFTRNVKGGSEKLDVSASPDSSQA